MSRHRNDPNARQHLMRLITRDYVSDERSAIGVVCMDPDAGAKALRIDARVRDIVAVGQQDMIQSSGFRDPAIEVAGPARSVDHQTQAACKRDVAVSAVRRAGVIPEPPHAGSQGLREEACRYLQTIWRPNGSHRTDEDASPRIFCFLFTCRLVRRTRSRVSVDA